MSWKRFQQTVVCLHYRGGWVGVWDSIVSAVKDRHRKTVPMPMTVSLYYKPIDGAELTVEVTPHDFQAVQLEYGAAPTVFEKENK